MPATQLVRTILVTLAGLAPACAILEPEDETCVGGKCDFGDDQSCSDMRYDDAACDLDLSCDVPDIDCFSTFPNDQAAASWFADLESRLAFESNRSARALLPETDPRFVKMRALLDRAWDAFRRTRPVGERLVGERPALVLVEDELVNAFVAPDIITERTAFAVLVLTGLVALNATDDEILSVMMHELQHAIGLHLAYGVRDRLRRFYVAPDGKEPIGKLEVEDARAREFGVAWRAAAGEAGYLANAELGGFPLSGQLHRVLLAAIQRGQDANPMGCTPSVERYEAFRRELVSALDPLSDTLTASLSGMPGRVDTTLASLRDECLAGTTATFAEVLAEIAWSTPDAIEALMTPEDKALVAGKHIIDAVATLVVDRRAKMRGAELAFTTRTGRPWAALRYFSVEEDADDVTVPVLRATGFEPSGSFLLALMGATETQCTDLLARGEVPPYGLNLSDEHHATCWRVHHVRALAAAATRAAPRAIEAAPTGPPPPRLPIPPLLSDRIIY